MFHVFVGENLSTISAGMRTKERKSYIEMYNEIWGVKTNKDERTAEQIIEDTFRKHGLKLKKKEAVNESV